MCDQNSAMWGMVIVSWQEPLHRSDGEELMTIPRELSSFDCGTKMGDKNRNWWLSFSVQRSLKFKPRAQGPAFCLTRITTATGSRTPGVLVIELRAGVRPRG